MPFGDLDAVEAAIGPETAAIMVEPVQGEGGVRGRRAEFLQGLRDLCDEHGLLLVLDEVQTGMGRTGKLFAHEWAGITPDVMAVAKGIGGGFPIGAVLATDEAAKGMAPGTHGSTFGGNPLAMAVGNAVLDVVLEPGFLEARAGNGAAPEAGARPPQGRVPGPVSRRCAASGLLTGIKLKRPTADAVTAALGEKLLTVGAGDNVVRLLPPLNVERGRDRGRRSTALSRALHAPPPKPDLNLHSEPP